jgi:signal peptidase I
MENNKNGHRGKPRRVPRVRGHPDKSRPPPGSVPENAPAPSPAPGPPRRAQPSVWRDLCSLLAKVAAVCAVFALAFTLVYGLHRNLEPGMIPSVKDGDLVMFYRLDKDYEAGDILLLAFKGKTQARRVVAAAGDTVDITSNGLAVNGSLQQELSIYEKTERYADGIELPLTLGEGEVFVLGDARGNAADSRVYGPVNVKDTLGTVIAVIRRRNL